MNRNRQVLGAILLFVGILGLAVSSAFLSMWSYPIWSYPMWHMGPMMWRGMTGRWSYDELKEISGTVQSIGWMEVDLKADQKEVEMHGPYWFWENIGIGEGDTVTAKGVFIAMMERGEGWHEGFIPFELTVNGRTYGDAGNRIPIWLQDQYAA